jgi:hypothetical protein
MEIMEMQPKKNHHDADRNGSNPGYDNITMHFVHYLSDMRHRRSEEELFTNSKSYAQDMHKTCRKAAHLRAQSSPAAPFCCAQTSTSTLLLQTAGRGA